MTDTITLLRVDQLHESPFNPRKIFDEAALQELATDIKAQGRVLSPLLVRPRIPALFAGDPEATAGHEIVFGHRRYRAAELAGLVEVPCMVRAMNDDEARRAQISENLQRKDVHAIEEAEGFQALIDNDNQTADTIAEQFGKSRSYVYGRLKLLEACPEIRRACLAGEIGSEVTLLVARLRTVKLQEKALQAIRAQYIDMKDGGSKSYRHIRSLLVEKFTLDLKTAMFNIEDEMLLPLAGNCVDCPKRSSNAPEFVDIVENTKSRYGNEIRGSANACTDPDCFEAKIKAHLKREAGKLEATGQVVVQGGAARTAISAHGEIKNGYVALKDVQGLLKKAPKRNSLAGIPVPAPQVVLIQDPRTGKTHKAVKVDEVKAAGVVIKASTSDASAGHAIRQAKAEAEQVKRRATHQAQQALNDTILDRTLQAMQDQPRTTQELYWMAQIVFDATDWDVRKSLAKRHGFEKPDQLEKVLGQWPPTRLALFAIECVLANDGQVDEYRHYPNGGAHARLMAAAKHYGVKISDVIAEPAPTPALAARADKKAKAAPAGAKGKEKKKSSVSLGALMREGEKLQKRMDDAGVAGGSRGQADLLEEAGA